MSAGRFIVIAVCAVTVVAFVALALDSAAQPGTVVLPAPTLTPTAAAERTATATATVIPTPTPRVALAATATPAPRFDLNFDRWTYELLGMNAREAVALWSLRCADAGELPRHPAFLEGCGFNARGIWTLRQLVDGGVMTLDRIIELNLADRTVHPWE